MLYPVRISSNHKGGFKFTLPKLVKSGKGWCQSDVYMAYPVSQDSIVIQHYTKIPEDFYKNVNDQYRKFVYKLYVVPGRTQIQFELPKRLCQACGWDNEKILVVVDNGLNYVSLRKVNSL